MITEYEFHLKTKLCFSELMGKLESIGYKYKVKLIKDMDGVKVYISNNSSTIEAIMALYEEENGYYTYEVKMYTKEDFTKLHDIMESL